MDLLRRGSGRRSRCTKAKFSCACAKPFNRLFGYSTPIEALEGWLDDHPSLPPAGFVFHMSRCGSTLLSQMVAAIPRNVVLSEAAPIDAVVQARHTRPDLGDEQHAAWLRWMIGALGQPRGGNERGYFTKPRRLAHLRAGAAVRAAFPDVPWIFLYRDPVEVLVSHLRMPGLQMLAGADPICPTSTRPASQTIRRIFARRRSAGSARRRCNSPAAASRCSVDYRRLPEAVATMVAPHFGLACSDQDRDAMAMAAISTPRCRVCVHAR